MHGHLITAALATLASAALADPVPVRTPIGTYPIAPEKPVSRVEAMRVDFLPGEQMPEHKHPVPVVCFVAKGSLLVSLGSAPVRKISVGDATIEAAGEIVHYFRNASSIDPAELYCAFLAGKYDKQLSIMLNK